MNLRHISIVIASALTPGLVYAGNKAWESSIKYTYNGDLTGRELPLEGNRATAKVSRDSAHVDTKRFLAIKPGTGEDDTRRWPKGVIKCCFESDDTRAKVHDDLIEAQKLWYAADLPETFKLDMTRDPDFCNEPSNRMNYLLIKYTEDGGLATTVGIEPVRGSLASSNPTMRLTDSLDVGTMNVVVNYAHELGHAWGLHHEHQNQAYWTKPYSSSGGTIFGEGNWNCKNLKDYNSYVQGLQEVGEPADVIKAKVALVCSEYSAALKAKFSAFNYLPLTEEALLPSQKKIDWKSIMIYPSGAGGIVSGSGEGDNRLPILLKDDGTRIEPNLTPSPLDVEGLKILYEVKTSRLWKPLGSLGSSMKDAINKIRRKEPDSGCSLATTVDGN